VRLALLIAALLFLPSGAAAQGFVDPTAFVRERFAIYERGQVPQSWPDRPYSPRLARLFEALAAAEGGEERIDFDWWVNGQDFELAVVEVVLERSRGDRRTFLARWRNFGRADSSRFLFVRRQGRWFLDNVVNTTSGWRLSELLRDAARR
jgi:hypothetical protein